MSPSTSLVTVALALAGFAGVAQAMTPSPFALPANGWAGIDGNWSTIEFSLGSDSDPVHVLIGTALSEFWTVGTGGCYPKEPHCSDARGGLHSPQESDDWQSMGTWELGLQHLGYGGAGDYGLDRITSTSTIQTGAEFAMDGVLMSVVNTTDYFLGQFGVGITQGNFGDTVAKSPLTSAVETSGLIPSYSYGYTAGAHYRNMPASATLGGFDASRFKTHDTEFTVSKKDSLLRTLVRGIQVKADGTQAAPEDWGTDVNVLSGWNDSFTALIDTSTPFLWLPDTICDKFAQSLGLSYDQEIELYKISNDQYRDYRHPESYTFTFTLSSTDNNDDLGDPLNTPGVLNITLPIRALVSTVEYPFHNEAIEYGASAVPYFSLRKSGDNSTFVIGRSFLQETYLVAQYDKAVFSIHQALFPDDPVSNADIVAIDQPPNSPYPPPSSSKKGGLGKPEIAGIAIGASAAAVLLIMGCWYYRRRKTAPVRRSSRFWAEGVDFETASAAGSLKSGTSGRTSPFGRILTKMVRSKRPAARSQSRTEQQGGQPFEAPNHEIYELPAPPQLVELSGDNGDNGDNDEDSADERAIIGFDRQQMSPYDQARLKIDRQLAGPLPAYSPPADGVAPPPEKDGYVYEQPRPVPPVRAESVPPLSPSSNDYSGNSDSLQGSMGSVVSPISHTTNGTMSWGDEPSPVAMNAPQLPMPMGLGARSLSDPHRRAPDQSESDRAPSPPGDSPPSSSLAQRTPIDPSRVVCLGPLPDNFQLLHQVSLPEIRGFVRQEARPPIDPSRVVCLGPLPDSVQLPHQTSLPEIRGFARQETSPPSNHSNPTTYEDTLGSNYTEEEDRLAELVTMASQYGQQQQQGTTRWPLETQGLQRTQYSPSNPSPYADTPQSHGRIDGMEFIHVPQPAERRYSWEEER